MNSLSRRGETPYLDPCKNNRFESGVAHIVGGSAITAGGSLITAGGTPITAGGFSIRTL